MSRYKLPCILHPDFGTPIQHFPLDPLHEPNTYKFKNQTADHFKRYVRLNCEFTVSRDSRYTFVLIGEK